MELKKSNNNMENTIFPIIQTSNYSHKDLIYLLKHEYENQTQLEFFKILSDLLEEVAVYSIRNVSETVLVDLIKDVV